MNSAYSRTLDNLHYHIGNCRYDNRNPMWRADLEKQPKGPFVLHELGVVGTYDVLWQGCGQGKIAS